MQGVSLCIALVILVLMILEVTAAFAMGNYSELSEIISTTLGPADAANVTNKIICDSSAMLDHSKVSPPRLLILGLFSLLILIKTIAKMFPIITKYCPESSLFVVFGIVSGLPIGAYFPAPFNQHHFFDFLLPMIVLEASYFMSNNALVKNLKKILTFAVLGTFLNMVMIGGGLELLKNHFGFHIGLMHLLVFATILSAVDPVAVICVFEDIGVNENLYINVFGESLLNDGVSVVFFRLFSQFAVEDVPLSLGMLWIATVEFLKSAIGGSLVGCCGALLTGLATRYTRNNVSVQPIYVVFVPYCSYLFCEYFHISGIISIMICTICMKPYTNVNLTYESKSMVTFILKSVSSCSESYIFMFLGISVYQVSGTADVSFCLASVFLCIIARFITVYFLGFFVNIREPYKLSLVDQFVMAYGGLRGAVCFGLVMSLDGFLFPCKQYFASSSISVIIFTIFFQGMTIKMVVKYLRVALSNKNKEDPNSRLAVFSQELINQVMEGVAGVSGRSTADMIFHQLRRLHEDYLIQLLWYVKPQDLLALPQVEQEDASEDHTAVANGERRMEKINASAVKLNVIHETMERNEAFSAFKKYGSFTGISALDEASGNVMRKSQSMCQPASPFVCSINIPEAVIEEAEPEGTITLPKSLTRKPDTMTRNFSDRKLLTAIFEDQKTVHTNLYSRHFAENPQDQRPSIFTLFSNLPEDEEQDEAVHYNTLPNPRLHGTMLKRRPTVDVGRRETSPKPGSSTDRRDPPPKPVGKPRRESSPSGSKDRPTFFMGEHPSDEQDDPVTLTFKTGRFQVAKQSPSHSAKHKPAEGQSLLEIDEDAV